MESLTHRVHPRSILFGTPCMIQLFRVTLNDIVKHLMTVKWYSYIVRLDGALKTKVWKMSVVILHHNFKQLLYRCGTSGHPQKLSWVNKKNCQFKLFLHRCLSWEQIYSRIKNKCNFVFDAGVVGRKWSNSLKPLSICY